MGLFIRQTQNRQAMETENSHKFLRRAPMGFRSKITSNVPCVTVYKTTVFEYSRSLATTFRDILQLL